MNQLMFSATPGGLFVENSKCIRDGFTLNLSVSHKLGIETNHTV